MPSRLTLGQGLGTALDPVTGRVPCSSFFSLVSEHGAAVRLGVNAPAGRPGSGIQPSQNRTAWARQRLKAPKRHGCLAGRPAFRSRRSPPARVAHLVGPHRLLREGPNAVHRAISADTLRIGLENRIHPYERGHSRTAEGSGSPLGRPEPRDGGRGDPPLRGYRHSVPGSDLGSLLIERVP